MFKQRDRVYKAEALQLINESKTVLAKVFIHSQKRQPELVKLSKVQARALIHVATLGEGKRAQIRIRQADNCETVILG